MRAFILEITGGLTLLGGIWWIWPPAALIVTGVLLVFVAQGMAKKEAKR